MRQILFKARRVDGKGWVEGVPTYHFDIDYHSQGYDDVPPRLHHMITDDFSCIEVIPETVCQYTGLNDKNGKRIFEGDIIIFGDKKIKQVVEYRKGQYMARQINTKGSYIGLGYCDWEINSEIIGSVHDKNEEL